VTVEAFRASESLKAIAPALLAAQKALKNPEKNSTNPHFGNRYADLGACMGSAKDALNRYDCTLIQTFAPAAVGTVAVTTMVLHKSGEFISGTCTIPLDRDNAQGYGSAATYARRYGVQAICGMVAEDDDDGNAASSDRKGRPADPKKGLFGRR
jgi:hypothetical protein